MKIKIILIVLLLWLTACTSTPLEQAVTVVPTAPIPTLSATAVPPTPTLASPATTAPTKTSLPTATAVAATATPVPTAPPAEPEPARIQFTPGGASATINGRLQAGDSLDYLAWAEAGQWTHIELVSHNNIANFSLVGMSDGQPYKRLENEMRFWDGALPLTQDYRIQIKTLEATDFTLVLSIEPLTDILQPVWPIVDGFSGFLLGGSHNGQWLDAFALVPSLQDGERPYQLYINNRFQGSINASPPTINAPGPCGGTPAVSFSPEQDLANNIAIVARWEAAPRQPQSLPLETAVYQQAVAEFLQNQGIANPEVHLNSIDKIDLEGDGMDEVLITASRLTGLGNGLPTAAAGDYSLVLLRKVVGESVMTIPIAMKLFPEAVELADPVQYNILGILDLNGDGKLEIVLEGWYYEGRYVTVYENVNQEMQAVLTVGCRL